jgi:uncharacterized protein (DUF2237 family)
LVAGVALPVVLESTHQKALEFLTLEKLSSSPSFGVFQTGRQS